MARIFIVIRFDEEMKDRLVALQEALRQRGVQGRYCPRHNLHMTLAFIGERYDLTAIRRAVGEVVFEPFDLSLGALGSFPTKAGVIWCGVATPAPIQRLAAQLRQRLRAHGVNYKEAPFFPHISLVQQPSQILTDIHPPEATMHVEQVCVMKSERVDGNLVYAEI